jgi:hypothetical protein
LNSHTLFNSKLLFSSSQVAQLFDLPQVDEDITGWDLSFPISSEDRLGIFGMDILVLSM